MLLHIDFCDASTPQHTQSHYNRFNCINHGRQLQNSSQQRTLLRSLHNTVHVPGVLNKKCCGVLCCCSDINNVQRSRNINASTTYLLMLLLLLCEAINASKIDTWTQRRTRDG